MVLPIAIGSIFTECNHLGGRPTDLADFARQELLRGPEVLSQANGTVAGMIQILREAKMSIAPLLVASTCPGGPLTLPCYRSLKEDLLYRLAKAFPVSGVLLALHGAAAVEEIGDLEGDLLGAVLEDRVAVRHLHRRRVFQV